MKRKDKNCELIRMSDKLILLHNQISIYNKKELSLPRPSLAFLASFRHRITAYPLFFVAIFQSSHFYLMLFPFSSSTVTSHSDARVSIWWRSLCLFACLIAHITLDMATMRDAIVSHQLTALSHFQL